MSSIAGKKSALTWVVHISVLVLVLAWLFPTAGLFVSSFRTADQISSSGWWASLSKSESIVQLRTGGKNEAVQEDDLFIVEGNLRPIMMNLAVKPAFPPLVFHPELSVLMPLVKQLNSVMA